MPTPRDPIEFTRDDPNRPGEGIWERCGNIVAIDSDSLNILVNTLVGANNPVNLTVNPCVSTDQSVSIDTTARSFIDHGGVLDDKTTHVEIRVEVAPIRIAYKGIATQGVNPPGIGRLLYSGDSRIFRREIIESASFISNSASVTAYIQVSELIFTPFSVYEEPPC